MDKNNYTEKFINFHASKVYVRVSGEGQPIILIHGLGADHSIWNKNITALNKEFKVYAVDLPGFGKSGKPDTAYSIALFTEAIKKLIEEEGLTKVYLLGTSLGGRIVLDIALNNPEIVEKIIVVAPGGLSKLAKGIFSSTLGGKLMAFALKKRVFIQKVLSEMVFDTKWISPFLVDTYLERAKDKNYLRAIQRTGYALGQDIESFREKLPVIRNNTLIIWGEDDKIVPVSDGYYLHKVIKDSKLVIFSQCGHLSFVEKTIPFNRVIIDFLTVNSI